jgi:hypothetical protein
MYPSVRTMIPYHDREFLLTIHIFLSDVTGGSHPELILNDLDLSGDLSLSSEIECRCGSEKGEVG